MKGHDAHAGFPEVAYGENADKLVRAGYKVARVEQTETPDQLAARKKKHNRRHGPAPKVVNREVCSILSLGTRTFCYLDERSALEQGGASAQAQTGPLLVIREVVYEPPSSAMTDDADTDDDTPQAACEYGVTLVDAIRGSVTLGQFADDVLRSRMQTLLTSFTPCEVCFHSPTVLYCFMLRSHGHVVSSYYYRFSFKAARKRLRRLWNRSFKPTNARRCIPVESK